ncbi:MAG: carbamoyltransferase family protein [Chloroflexota bacterium]
MTRYYIGLAASFHDPALAIVDAEGNVLFAEATERYVQDKRGFNCPPDHQLRSAELVRTYCQPDAELVLALTWSQQVLDTLCLGALEQVSIYPPFLADLADLFYQSEDYRFWPFPNIKGLRTAMLGSLGQAGNNLLFHRDVPNSFRVRRYDHHLTHAAMGCYSSPFREAACAVVDGYGEWTSTSFFHYRDGELRPLQRRRHWLSPGTASLGMFYSLLCGLCGFSSLKGEEWKVMGLAAYGKVDPRLYDLLQPMVEAHGLEVRSGLSAEEHRVRLQALRRQVRPAGTSPLEAADLARTGQEVFADTMRDLLRNLHRLGISDDLVLAGGCALNSSFNGRIVMETPFRRVHVPSAPADDGNALGAALLACREDHPAVPLPRCALSPFLGTDISRPALENLVRFGGFTELAHLPEAVAERTAQVLADGKIVGWMQGRAEFGPRALGNRSILADPRRPDMKDRLNARVKFREEYRPFAPSILHECGPAYFEDYQDSPYMERALVFRPEVRDRVPAVVHADGTGRVQSVTAERNPKFYDLLSHFHRLTGVPLVLNTSFNVMGKPIIHSVEDALGVFCTSGIDVLVIDDYLIEKWPSRCPEKRPW